MQASDRLMQALRDIGDFAHDKSTGPAVPDALWEVRAMAYAALEAEEVQPAPAPLGNRVKTTRAAWTGRATHTCTGCGNDFRSEHSAYFHECTPRAPDIRNLSKWLNEEQESPIDRQALARVLAVAEQPAQQEPVARIAELEETVRHLNHALREATEAPTFMGEPVSAEPAASIKGVDEYGPMLNWYTHWVNFPVGTRIYTSPPAQRTWVGLTDDEVIDIAGSFDYRYDVARAIEAKLKEKNA